MKVEYATALIKVVAAAWMYCSQMVCLVVLEGRSLTFESLYPGTLPGKASHWSLVSYEE